MKGIARRTRKVKTILFFDRIMGRCSPPRLKNLALWIKAVGYSKKGRVVRKVYRGIQQSIENGLRYWPVSF